MDWLSLHQKHSDGTDRSDIERTLFNYALECTMDVWYGHQCIPVLIVTQLPQRYLEERAPGYDRTRRMLLKASPCLPSLLPVTSLLSMTNDNPPVL